MPAAARALRVLPLIVLLAFVSPLASAHLETFSQAKPLLVGPYNALLEPYPAPAFENSALTIRSLFTRVDTGRYATSLDVTLDFTSPSGATQTKRLEPDGTGYFVALVSIQEAGEHVAKLTIKDAAGTYANATNVTVYPDVGVRLRAADLDVMDPVVGAPYPLGIQVVDNVTLAPSVVLTDLTVKLEHWTDDHETLLGEVEVPLTDAGEGVWRATHTFPVAGMYHLRFASRSGGFNYDEVPLLHVYASTAAPTTGDPPGPREAPLPGLLAALGLAAAALATAARPRR